MSNYLSQNWLIDRRHALKALGSFISLPLLECMVPLKAAAAEKITATPKRSAFIYLANGVHSLNYQITTPGKDYKFSRSLAPLEKHRDVITPISGLHHPGALSHHHNCINVWLTGGKLAHRDVNVINRLHQRLQTDGDNRNADGSVTWLPAVNLVPNRTRHRAASRIDATAHHRGKQVVRRRLQRELFASARVSPDASHKQAFSVAHVRNP